MSALATYVVDAVVVEHRSPSILARDHGVSRRWIYKMLQRFRVGGYQALEPHSRRPHGCSHATPDASVAEVLKLRAELDAMGLDAGPMTITHHLEGRVANVPSPATVWRILKRHGLVTPQPHKRPRSSFVRFEASLPNETWQVDSTPWRLADGSPVELLNFVDDHSRTFVSARAFVTVKAPDVVNTFHLATKQFGIPASLLSDNAAVFSGRSRGGKVILELELERLGVQVKHSTPYHPQTCGKVERLHQTLKKYLAKQPPAPTLAELQVQLDSFRDYYNNVRPHRALNRTTPAAIFTTRLKAHPAELPQRPDPRVRKDRIDAFGRVTLRYLGRLRHIHVGMKHCNRKVRLFVSGPDVRIVTEDGELLRALTLDPTKDYQPLGGRWPVHNVLRQVSPMS